MIKIIVADPEKLSRRTLAMAINTQEDFIVSAEYESLEDLREDFELVVGVDIIILNLDLPSSGALVATEEIIALKKDAKIIIISSKCAEFFAPSAQKRGASAFVDKNIYPETFYNIIRTVYNGTKLFNFKQKTKRLSNREAELLEKLIHNPQSFKKIAEEMNINQKTLSTYKIRLFHKLGINSVVEIGELKNKIRL